MNCPRCDGPVEAYSLRDHEASVCQRCGWVGVDASLRGDEGDGPSESWEDSLERVVGRHVSTERSQTTLPPPVADAIRDDGASPASLEEFTVGDTVPGETPDTGREGSADSDQDARAGEDEDEDEEEDEDVVPLEDLDRVDGTDVDPLRSAGVGTVAALAAADPVELAAATDIPESRLREYVNSASIRLVASGSDED